MASAVTLLPWPMWCASTSTLPRGGEAGGGADDRLDVGAVLDLGVGDGAADTDDGEADDHGGRLDDVLAGGLDRDLVEPVMSPSTWARVAPETLAIGTITLMLIPPPPPPGVYEVAVSWLSASTSTVASVDDIDAVDDSVASTARSLRAIATVAPIAIAPTAMLSASTSALWSPSA